MCCLCWSSSYMVFSLCAGAEGASAGVTIAGSGVATAREGKCAVGVGIMQSAGSSQVCSAQHCSTLVVDPVPRCNAVLAGLVVLRCAVMYYTGADSQNGLQHSRRRRRGGRGKRRRVGVVSVQWEAGIPGTMLTRQKQGKRACAPPG
jgi:hypothetical protein